MPRRWTWVLALAGTLAGLSSAPGQDDAAPPEASRELRFLQGLRERGYHDLALDYLDTLRKAPETPAALKTILDYEEGRGLLDEATRMADLEARTAHLDKARAKLDAFAKAHPKHPLAPEALVQMARLLFERGQTAVLQANELKTPAEKATKLAQARAAYVEARSAYDRALKPLRDAFKAFPPFLPEQDKRRPARERAQVALLDAELQRVLIDYEEAQTHPAKSPQRLAMLDKALASFEDMYKRHRTQPAGLFARTFQAKCHEEKGELGPAMGIYKELMEHGAAELRPLQRKVAYFMIIVDGKRGEHPLAVDRASAWLQAYPSARNSDEGLGVQLELAKNILAQLDDLKDADKEAAIRRATDILQPVVRVYSPYKPEAVALLQKYRPRAAVGAASLAGMNFESAFVEGETALSSHEWDRAIALLRHAIRRADPVRRTADVNKARHLLSFAYYSAERYYESAVVAEHLARNYPKGEMSPRVAKIGIAALAGAYNAHTAIDRTADLNHLVELAKYTAQTWPETEEGDYARTMLAEIAMGRGRYAEAAEAFESVRQTSAGYLDARVKAGDAHWRHGLLLREQNQTKEADAASARALELLTTALKTRKDQGTPATDPGLITNTNALAEVHRASGRPKEALALLEPLAAALDKPELSGEAAPLREATLTFLLKAHIADGQSDKAVADMKVLEKVASSKAKLTQLYLDLVRSLQKEMEAQRARNDPAHARTRQALQQFLSALAASQEGQSYESLRFAGESMLGLGMTKEAVEVFERLLKTYENDAEFQKVTGWGEKLLVARLKLAEALRKAKQFDEAQTLVTDLMKQNPRQLEVRLEQGFLYEDWAATEASRWNAAYNHWRGLAGQLERIRPRRLEYFEAMYHVALALKGLGRPAEASQTLRSVMTLSPSVGNAEMKQKYQDLLKSLETTSARR